MQTFNRFVAMMILMIPASALPQQYTSTFTATIENNESTVSPGGVLYVKIVGSTTDPSGKGNYGGISISVSDPSVVSKYSTTFISYHVTEFLNHPRYVKIYIKEAIEGALPRTLSVNLSGGNPSTPFYIKEGEHGVSDLKDKYVANIVVDENAYNPVFWYEIFCISSKVGHCSIDIKNGSHDKYHGQVVEVAKHTCSDRGYPGGSRLDIREPFIFDARKMVVKHKGAYTAPFGQKASNNAVCKIISDSPIMLRPIQSRFIPEITR